ncbi:pimeloyl-ACP methyl ester carboxylesterase [Catenuloplanes nepalensis]|uniref:Pimeloyl-ACP methyl ester carboxylesterase n=1 Tax=Catenuloplanes nepalensis TaxID=587533 RepID=A0ABT9MVH7_9ACTN|nr:alpha/beta fold hydrolase [Catenuloplanes nepalensis]MDP9795447.1 pimeloyl-ACP methyl ester carboxylesterase [Catenuloplanes nepalensis]
MNSSFTTPDAQERFLALYRPALAPFPSSTSIPTPFGTAVAHHAGAATGTPVVLLSGAGGNAVAWHRYIAPLGRNHPVIALDLIGEPGLAEQTRPLTTAAEAIECLTATLDGLDAPRMHLAGMSYGGWAALRYALAAPSRVAGLTLLDPAGFGRVTAGFMAWVIAGGLAGLAPRALRHRLAGPARNATLRDDHLAALLPSLMAFRRRIPAPAVFTDEELASIGAPAMFLLGEHSALYPAAAAAARLESVMPAARVEIIKGASHDVPTYAPELVAARMTDFLDSAHHGQ